MQLAAVPPAKQFERKQMQPLFRPNFPFYNNTRLGELTFLNKKTLLRGRRWILFLLFFFLCDFLLFRLFCLNSKRGFVVCRWNEPFVCLSSRFASCAKGTWIRKLVSFSR